MELYQLTKHCWYTNSEPSTDRPSLGYILSDSGFGIVVDAGNSPKHYKEFLACLRQKGFPLPSLCAITHWHWDHTLGISAVDVPVIACDLTQQHLINMTKWTEKDIDDFYIVRHPNANFIVFCNQINSVNIIVRKQTLQ